MREFQGAEGGDWSMTVDPDGRIALRLGVAGIPESFLIGPDRLVVPGVLGDVLAEDREQLLRQAKAHRR